MVAEESRPNPQKRNILIQRIKRAPWWLLVVSLALIYIVLSVSDRPEYQIIWDAVKTGIRTTIVVSVQAYAIAVLLGLVFALMRLSRNFFLYQFSTLYVEVIRGIPTLVLVLYFALALTPKLVDWSNELGAWLVENNLDLFGQATYIRDLKTRDVDQQHRVVAALAISYSAFLSEIFRAGIQSVDFGQIEAARSLGLNRWRVTGLIVLPQAFRTVLPPLANDFIAMLKESSLVSVVGVEDITRRGRTYSASTFRFFETYNVVALTYLVLTLSLAMAVKLLEAYMDRGKRKD